MGTILALDLGKFKTVACTYDPEEQLPHNYFLAGVPIGATVESARVGVEANRLGWVEPEPALRWQHPAWPLKITRGEQASPLDLIPLPVGQALAPPDGAIMRSNRCSEPAALRRSRRDIVRASRSLNSGVWRVSVFQRFTAM